jgi:hypothetical protein
VKRVPFLRHLLQYIEPRACPGSCCPLIVRQVLEEAARNATSSNTWDFHLDLLNMVNIAAIMSQCLSL